MTPAACTSFDFWQKSLGKSWRKIHLLSVPAFLLTSFHAILIGSHYLGSLKSTGTNKLAVVLLGIITLIVLLVRWRGFWSILNLEKFYVSPSKS
jgi:DMSO/TMAO reductase YedYZ heme-binding membrane subunit